MNLQEAAAELHPTYLAYRSLTAAALPGKGAAGGRLLLLTRQGPLVTHRAVAARIAGLSTLWVVESSDEAKIALRSGACDFLVSSLDEALRILKNEVRRQASVTVCLGGLPSAVQAECVQRGVQPNLLEEPNLVLENRGAACVHWQTALPEGEHGVCWYVTGDLAAHTELDRMVRSVMDHSTDHSIDERKHWLTTSSNVLGRRRQRYRFLPMSLGEWEHFRQLASSSSVIIEVVSETGNGPLGRGSFGEDGAP